VPQPIRTPDTEPGDRRRANWLRRLIARGAYRLADAEDRRRARVDDRRARRAARRGR